MTSILLSIMPFIAILITPGEATTQITDNYSSTNILQSPTLERCPTIETKEFGKVSYNTDSSMYESCARLDIEFHGPSDPEIAFYMTYGQLIHTVQHMCIYEYGQPVIMFSCAPHSSSPSGDPKPNSIERIYGRFVEPTIEYDYRCAMYKNDEGIMNMMAISPNKSCDGLPDMLSNPEANIPVGYVLLYPVYPNRPKYFQKRSTSDIKYKKRIYSGSRFFWRTG